jgi:hypothetical protein
MSNDPTRVTIHVGQDPRLVAVVHGAARVAAMQAGFDDERCDQFARASEEICRESLLQLAEVGGNLELTLETFSDRIEISVHHQGQLIPALGLEAFVIQEAFSGRPGGLTGAELLECVDRVMFNTENGVARTTLVKYLPPSG